MSKTQQHDWTIGDVFLVKTIDGMSVLGQVIAKGEILNSASCVFFDYRVWDENAINNLAELPLDKVFSVLLVTRDFLDNGVWRVVANLPVTFPKDKFPFENLREHGYVGAKVIGTKIVNEFINAFYGFVPWDDWKDPHYLDKLLVSPDMKPRHLKYKSP